MRTLNIPKVIRPLQLADYAEELKDTVIWVWVNPPVSLLERWSALASESLQAIEQLNAPSDNTEVVERVRATLERIGTEEAGIISELWSQKEGDTWLAEDVLRLVEETRETDPMLWAWLQTRTRAMIREHRNGIKKA